MLQLLRHPAGEGYMVQRKIVWFLLMWFIVSGLFRDNHFVSATNEEDHSFQKTSNDKHEVQKNSSIPNKDSAPLSVINDVDSQLESNRKIRAVPPRVKTPNKEPHSWDELNDEYLGYIRKIPIQVVEFRRITVPRPGRSGNMEDDSEHLTLFDYRKRNEDGEKRNTLIPMARFGRSYNAELANLGVENFEGNHRLNKRSNTINPIRGPGKGSNKVKRDTLTSVIPYPRLGRFSTMYGGQDLAEGEVKTNLMDKRNMFVDSEYDDLDFSNSVQKREEQVETDTVIPYPRPGRSDSYNNLYSQVKRETSEYVVPQIRYGRSVLLLSTTKNDKSVKEKPHIFVLPYPRPGRSNEENDVRFKYSNVLLPYPRPGHFNKDHDVKEMSFSNGKKRQDYMLPTARLGRSTLNTRFEDGNIMDAGEAFLGLTLNPLFLKNVSEKSNGLDISDSSFVIPYPRPGKKSMLKIKNSNKVAEVSNTDNTKFTDYVLPYPRPGKKFSNVPSARKFKDINSKNENPEKQNFILPYPRPGRYDHDWLEKQKTQEKYQDIQDEDYEAFEDQYQNADELLENNNDSTGSDTNILNLENSSSGFRFKRSNTIVPYPRLGRSHFVVPYPRLGRSNTVIPYPRLGRSTYVVPYPRPGRSNSIVPYPRPGRSNAVIPYPRLGRSKTVIPYPRLGRSNSVIPYPRLGRSNTIVPYPRLGRSNSVIQYPKLGRSASVIPYPRPGKSISYNSVYGVDESYSIIPSATNSVYPNLRLRKSNYITPYPRPGRSQDDRMFSLYNRQKEYLSPNHSQDGDYSKRQDTYIVPYPRPGRFIEKKGSENSMVIPYPRPGRSYRNSGYVLPHPRVGRSEYIAFNDPKISIDGSIMPLPPVERSQQATPPELLNSIHKLNKHMIPNADDSIYLLPYPRPGRYSE